MASNGLVERAKHGKCRICQRTRSTEKHVKAVGEVSHGYATGHIWECIDADECERVARERLKDESRRDRWRIEQSLKIGRFNDEYKCFS